MVAGAALLVWAARPARQAVAARIGLASLLAVAFLEARAGHASTLVGGTLVATVASAGHMLAAGVWAGGLVVLLLFVVPVMRRPGEARPEGLALIGAWLQPAGRHRRPWCCWRRACTSPGRHVPDLHALASTVYGVAVSGKALLVVAALALAGLNTLLVNPTLAARVGRLARRGPDWAPVPVGRFGLLVCAEALVLVAAVGAAALATAVPSAREVSAADRTTAPQQATVDGLFLTVEQVPAGPDKSRVVVRARSTVLPPPLRFAASMCSSSAQETARRGSTSSGSRRDATRRFTRARAGRWKAWVAVRRDRSPRRRGRGALGRASAPRATTRRR